MPVIGTAVLLQWDLLGSSSWVEDFPPWQVRPALIAFQVSLFAATAVAVRRVDLRQARAAGIAALIVATGLVLAVSVRASAAASMARPRDYERQLALRDGLPPDRRVLLLSQSPVSVAGRDPNRWRDSLAIEVNERTK